MKMLNIGIELPLDMVTATTAVLAKKGGGKIIATLEADVATAHVALQEALARVAELEEKIAALSVER